LISLKSIGVSAAAQGIKIGWSYTDITPTKPVQLYGQEYERISTGNHDQLQSSVMAIESASGDMQAIMVSVDLCHPAFGLQKDLRSRLSGRLSGFNLNNLFMFATHTHTAPYYFDAGNPGSGVMKGSEYRDFMLNKVADAVVSAWNNRANAAVGFAQTSSGFGWNRISTYQDGHAVMVGSTVSDNGSAYIDREGLNDQTLNLMYGFDSIGILKGIVVNIACPAQDVSGLSVVSADFWGEARDQLISHYPGVVILPQLAPAGDQGPWPGNANDDWNRLTEHAAAIKNAVVNQFNSSKNSRQSLVVLKHIVQNIDLTCKSVWGGTYPFELHAIRIGNVSFANNPCELYVDYANQIHNQSKSSQEFLIQLSGSADETRYIVQDLPYPGTKRYNAAYLCTAKAIAGNINNSCYPAFDTSGLIGPTGGDELVKQTVSIINSLFSGRKPKIKASN
jgi:hypothetical protein